MNAIDRLFELAEYLGLTPLHLDMAVYDCGGTSYINNEGLEAQISFLLEHNSEAIVEAIIRTVDENGNYVC